MPTYEYQCHKCGHVFEVQQSFADEPISKCVSCRGKVRKLFSAPAIIFKGKGFHCTDYKSKGGPAKSTPCGAESCSTAKSEGTCEPSATACEAKSA